MNDRSELITTSFNYLVDTYGFTVKMKEFDPMSMGNAIVVYNSKYVSIEIVIDRGQVLISIGKADMPRNTWFDITDVVSFFAQDIVVYEFIEKNKERTQEQAVMMQLDHLSIILQKYCSPILGGNLNSFPNIERIEKNRQNEMLKKFTRGEKNNKRN